MNFIYRGSGVAFGGQMTRPFVDAPTAQAATSVPPVGGYASACAQDYTYVYEGKDLVSFRAAASQAVASESVEDGVQTFSTQVLRVLRDLLTADKIVGRLTSRHPAPPPPVELPMLPDGSYIWNLRIAGQPVSPRTHADLVHEKTATKTEVDRICGRLLNPRDGKPARSGNPTIVSIFDDASLPKQRQLKGATLNPGWRIDIPDFGRIFLGEYLVFPDRRLLIMVRLQMGSPQAGELVLGSVEGNGSPPT
jgi:hypothetical protein